MDAPLSPCRKRNSPLERHCFGDSLLEVCPSVKFWFRRIQIFTSSILGKKNPDALGRIKEMPLAFFTLVVFVFSPCLASLFSLFSSFLSPSISFVSLPISCLLLPPLPSPSPRPFQAPGSSSLAPCLPCLPSCSTFYLPPASLLFPPLSLCSSSRCLFLCFYSHFTLYCLSFL